MGSETRKYSWLKARFWLWLIVYWLVSMIGAGIMARQGATGLESGWVIFVMLAFVIVCMATERGEWKTWQRVGFIFLAWVLQAFLTIPVFFTIGMFMGAAGRLNLVDRAVAFFATIPIVIFAMRNSRLFVRPRNAPGGTQQDTGNSSYTALIS